VKQLPRIGIQLCTGGREREREGGGEREEFVKLPRKEILKLRAQTQVSKTPAHAYPLDAHAQGGGCAGGVAPAMQAKASEKILRLSLSPFFLSLCPIFSPSCLSLTESELTRNWVTVLDGHQVCFYMHSFSRT
jgi:hypothetical protein